MSDDPFETWAASLNAPNEEELHAQPDRTHILYNEEATADGGVHIQIFPSSMARQSAAVISGQFQALLDTRVFTREEAFRIVLESMSAVVIHSGDDDEDE